MSIILYLLTIKKITMKKRLLILLLFPILSYGQIQIGQDIDGEDGGDNSGWSVSLSSDGSILAIGATHNDGNNFNSGHVRVYENQESVWIQIGEDIDGDAEAIADFLGQSVSLSFDGNIVAISAWRNDDNGENSGHVRVYENQSGSWVQIGQDIGGEAAGDASGYNISLSSDGNIVAIGAPYNNGNGENSGHVRVYENQGDTWIQIGQDIDGENTGDFLGYKISLSSDGSIVAIGGTRNDDNGNDSGHVRVYENQSGSWVKIGQDIDGEAAGDSSGWSISLSSDGRVVAIGARDNDGNGNNSGHVRVYENQDDVWVQIGEDIDGEAIGDRSGTNVSLSSYGNIVAIGAYLNGGNGENSGHVRVYENQSGSWVQIGQDIDGEASGDASGVSVSLSSNGNIVAIGAPYNRDASGHARVFDLSALLSTEEVVQSQFTIYPNPATTTVTIQLDQNSSLEKATIYNSLGQVVQTSTEITIDTSDLSKGIYILEVTTLQGKASRKLMIE